MARTRTLFALGFTSIALVACQTAYETAATQVGEAAILDRSGTQIGTARIYSLAEEVTFSASFDGLTTGVHAVHLHTKGDCSADDFTSAGGHLNPGGNQHGTLNPAGAHLGDLPNLTVDAGGAGTVSTLLRGTRSTIEASIFDSDGTAVVVHEGADDYRTDPAGAAGSRIACGVVARN